MKFSVYLMIAIAMIGCNSNAQNSSLSEANNCENIKKFGNKSFCLVEIDGMTECYSNPVVKPHVDSITSPSVEVLAVYYNDTTYSNIDNLGSFSFEDYFFVTTPQKAKGANFTIKDLDDVAEMMANSTEHADWIESISDVQERVKHKISIGKPVLIESYSIKPEIRSFVMLSKRIDQQEEVVFVNVTNIMLLKNSLIFYFYYLNYRGQSSLEKAKAKSDYFGILLSEANQE